MSQVNTSPAAHTSRIPSALNTTLKIDRYRLSARDTRGQAPCNERETTRSGAKSEGQHVPTPTHTASETTLQSKPAEGRGSKQDLKAEQEKLEGGPSQTSKRVDGEGDTVVEGGDNGTNHMGLLRRFISRGSLQMMGAYHMVVEVVEKKKEENEVVERSRGQGQGFMERDMDALLAAMEDNIGV